jgi:CelD/BcsL family acetyltransferase involved in cellulose biosynthesis
LNIKELEEQHRSLLNFEPLPLASSREYMTFPDLKVHSEWGTVELVEAIAEEWRQLCVDGPCNEPFFRPEWIAAAIRAFGGPQQVLLITVRNGSRLRGVLPLLEKKRRTSQITGTRLRSASLIPRFEFVHDGDPDLGDVVRAAWQHLRNLPGWDAIELVNVPEGGAAEHLLAAAREDAFLTCRHEYALSPYIDLSERRPGEDFSRFGLSSRFRYHLRQGWREISKRGSLRLRRTERADPETLQHFYRLEQSGWKGKKGTAIVCRPDLHHFYDAIVHYAEQFGYLSMYFLELDDAIIAAHLAFTYGGRYYPIKVAYDESFSEYGPGHLIIGRILEDCIQRGLSRFDCLGEWTNAKAKWTSHVRPHATCCIFKNTPAGRILRAETQLQHNLRQTARRVVAAARSHVARLKSWRLRRPWRSALANKSQFEK